MTGAAAAWLLLVFSDCLAQTPEPVLRITVNLVQVEAVVTDSGVAKSAIIQADLPAGAGGSAAPLGDPAAPPAAGVLLKPPL